MNEEQAKAEEEDNKEKKDDDEDQEEEEDVSDDEGVELDAPEDQLNTDHAVLGNDEGVKEEVSPALEDVMMSSSHLHLPGYEEVEKLALLLLQLADEGDSHIIPAELRKKIVAAAGQLHDHDKSARNFVKKYESKWGYTIFGRCLGADSAEASAAQKTKFGWMRYAQAAEIKEDSRLLYLVIKMLKNRPAASALSSPNKVANIVKGQYKRIVDRVRDDPILAEHQLPMPNINAKSITTFLNKQEKRANYLATTIPKVTTHRRVVSSAPIPEADPLPSSLPPPSHTEVQYQSTAPEFGKRRGEKRRLQFDEPSASTSTESAASTPESASSTSTKPKLQSLAPKFPSLASLSQASGAPILLVVPSQPRAPSVNLCQPSTSPGLPFTFQPRPPPPPKLKPQIPKKSSKPCAACQVPQCGGLRKRYTPSKDKTEGSKQKIFTFCPKTNRSTTPGFEREFTDYEHFKREIDEELLRRKNTPKE